LLLGVHHEGTKDTKWWCFKRLEYRRFSKDPGVGFDGALSGMGSLKSWAAGMRFVNRSTRFPSACASGFEAGASLRVGAKWAEPNFWKPEARAEGLRFVNQSTRFPSACALGFEAGVLLLVGAERN
jgi:hypothetical protein